MGEIVMGEVFLCGNFTATLLLFFLGLAKVERDFGAVTRNSVGDFSEVASGSSNAPPLCGVVMGTLLVVGTSLVGCLLLGWVVRGQTLEV